MKVLVLNANNGCAKWRALNKIQSMSHRQTDDRNEAEEKE